MPQRNPQIVTKLCKVCALLLLFVGFSARAGDLLIQVQDRRGDAPLYLALVPAEQKSWEPMLRQLQGEGSQLRLTDLPPGRYAVQLFQDSNGNGQLDLSPRGLPLEPVGFSSNPSLFKGKPSPKGAAFEHGEQDTLITIRLHPGRARPAS